MARFGQMTKDHMAKGQISSKNVSQFSRVKIEPGKGWMVKSWSG